MRPLSLLKTHYESLSPAKKTILQSALTWSIAGGIVWYISRGLTFAGLLRAIEKSNIALFIAFNLAAFLVRWLGDTYLFSKLFTFFHRPTTFRQVLPASAAQYFLQAINTVIADGPMVVFLHQRQRVDWITAGWTMAFQAFIDAIVLSTLTVLAGLLVPESPIRLALPYAGGALLFLICAALWWMWGRSVTRLGRWLRDRKGMHAFRSARPRHYAILGAIRAGIHVSNGLLFYLDLVSFHLLVPLIPVLALTPAFMLSQSQPVTPSGLGPLQIVMMDGLSRFAPRNELLAVSISISIVQLCCRIPLGIGTAGMFARGVLAREEPPMPQAQSGERGREPHATRRDNKPREIPRHDSGTN